MSTATVDTLTTISSLSSISSPSSTRCSSDSLVSLEYSDDDPLERPFRILCIHLSSLSFHLSQLRQRFSLSPDPASSDFHSEPNPLNSLTVSVLDLLALSQRRLSELGEWIGVALAEDSENLKDSDSECPGIQWIRTETGTTNAMKRRSQGRTGSSSSAVVSLDRLVGLIHFAEIYIARFRRLKVPKQLRANIERDEGVVGRRTGRRRRQRQDRGRSSRGRRRRQNSVRLHSPRQIWGGVVGFVKKRIWRTKVERIRRFLLDFSGGLLRIVASLPKEDGPTTADPPFSPLNTTYRTNLVGPVREELDATLETVAKYVESDRKRSDLIRAVRGFLVFGAVGHTDVESIDRSMIVFERYPSDALALLFRGLAYEVGLGDSRSEDDFASSCSSSSRRPLRKNWILASAMYSRSKLQAEKRRMRNLDVFSSRSLECEVIRILEEERQPASFDPYVRLDGLYAVGLIHLFVFGNESEAIQFFRRSVAVAELLTEDFSRSVPGLHRLANVSYRRGDHRTAFRFYLRATELDKNNVSARINCALMLEHNLVHAENVCEARKLAWLFYLAAARCSRCDADRYRSFLALSEAVGRGLAVSGGVVCLEEQGKQAEKAAELRRKAMMFLRRIAPEEEE